MSATKAPRIRVVVDGSNFATEGRTIPSLVQLDEAVRAFLDENPTAEVIVVADASFEHRVAPGERARFKESELAGEIVTPPAGAVGRGDAFILKIADRIDAVVLSNDSFQEFHDEYPWLFEIGRLIGGKPVPSVGWVFTPRLPVRNIKNSRSVKKLAVALPNGAKPAIGTTLIPVKVVKAPLNKASLTRAPSKKAAPAVAKAPLKAPSKKPIKVSKKSAKTVTVTEPAAKKSVVKKLPPAKKIAAPKTLPKVPTKHGPKIVEIIESAPPMVALRRGRQPVNPEAQFLLFRATYKVGARLDGEVTAFTSHGAVIKVALRGDQHVECYAPTTLLATPAPARARDVLKRGDRRTFRLATVDDERRIAELALS